MPREFSRKMRVSNAIRKLIAPIIDRESKDHGLGLVSVTEVTVSPDMGQSDVYLSVFGDEQHQKQALSYFNEIAREIRMEIAAEMTMKRNPALRFKLDGAIAQGDKMARLIKENASIKHD